MSPRTSLYTREDIDPTITEDALKLVNNDNIHKLSDHPSDYHARIADVWSALFGWTVRSEDVSLALLAIKMVAETGTHSRDNIVGIVQHALCLDAVARTEKNIERLWNEGKVTVATAPRDDKNRWLGHDGNAHSRA
jgi:hypothetical protein